MTKLHYRIAEHDGGWAYKLGEVFSEPFASRQAAIQAAHRVAQEQHVPGETVAIEYQNEQGEWVTERADGGDRPDVDVVE